MLHHPAALGYVAASMVGGAIGKKVTMKARSAIQGDAGAHKETEGQGVDDKQIVFDGAEVRDIRIKLRLKPLPSAGARAMLYNDAARMFGMKMTSGSHVVAHLRPLLKVVMTNTSSQGGGYVLACVKKWRYSDRAPLVGVAGLSGTYTSHVSSNFGVGKKSSPNRLLFLIC